MLSNFKPVKVRSEKHRRFIASLPCLITGAPDVQACHIRHGNGAGVGLKSGDDCCIPLSCSQHALQHRTSEVEYWGQYGGIERATKLAKALYKHTGDRDKAIELIMEFRR